MTTGTFGWDVGTRLWGSGIEGSLAGAGYSQHCFEPHSLGRGAHGQEKHTTPEFHLSLATSLPDEGALLWTWSYSGEGITASGTLTTTDTADADGFHLITDITGTRNGEAIVALQPTGTSIPGNEPFAVDNLISLTDPQLTGSGFGYAIADGTFANPFFADFLSPPGYLEFFSAPPFGSSAGLEDSELPVSFAACAAPRFDVADAEPSVVWQWFA